VLELFWINTECKSWIMKSKPGLLKEMLFIIKYTIVYNCYTNFYFEIQI